jgi:hypothetical protein
MKKTTYASSFSKISLYFTINKIFFVQHILILIFLFTTLDLSAQKDILFKKDSTQIRCKVLTETGTAYTYAFINIKNKVAKTSIFKTFVDSVQYNYYDSNLVTHKLFNNEPPLVADEPPAKHYQRTLSIGLNLGNILEFNAPSGNDKKSFSLTAALDLRLDYFKESSRFAMTNELHWTVALQKSGLTSGTHIQRATDDISTLHDFSFAIGKNNKWNFNLIVKTNTSIFTIFDGDYFKDYNSNGKVQAFLNPYEVIISPGIKYQPDKYFRLSLSPYSISLHGLTNQQIANTGFYTQTVDAANNYDLFVFKQPGAELNIWYDRKIKKWLEMKYRLGISSDYFKKIANNGLMNGLFITKIKIIKNVYLTHRAIFKADFTMKPFKPYYSQTILLSYAKSF